MADGEGPEFSIADAAAASWLAHRASTPNTRRSSSTHNDSSGPRQTPVSVPVLPTSTAMPAPASVSASSAGTSTPTPAPDSDDRPAEGSYVATTEPPHSAQSQEPPAPPSTIGSWEAGEGAIQSDITAWESALQSLPAEFAHSTRPNHPLALALVDQPTLRPVEWNLYRQQGGFFPRTPHDFSSLMIYLCGQVNPNPCRNCLLRNGPFARCVVSPPSVLAISSLRHACANCTYQMQYKKCTNEPITEVEKTRADLARPVASAQGNRLIPKPSLAKRPKKPNQRKLMKEQQRIWRLQEEQSGHKKPSRKQQPAPQQPLPAGPTPNFTSTQPASLESFADKLRHVRQSSPRSRRHMMAQAMQWQAAITTVESEQASSDVPAAGAYATPSQPAMMPPSAARYSGVSYTLTPTMNQDAMEEDDSEGEQGGGYRWSQK